MRITNVMLSLEVLKTPIQKLRWKLYKLLVSLIHQKIH
jgi:hypothetical protein